MLINIRISELQSNTSNSIALSIIIAIWFNSSLFPLLPYDIANLGGATSSFNYIYDHSNNLYNSIITSDGFQPYNIKDIFFVTSKIWDGNLAENNHITTIGNLMYTNYNIWLIIASFILLLAMTGAIVITIKK